MSVLDFVRKLNKLEGALTEQVDAFANPLQSPSPMFNSIFGNSWGLPPGYSTLAWGPYKGGKSLVTNAIIGHTHQADPEAITITFDTEMRREGQLTPEIAAAYGIDIPRNIIYRVNKPDLVWDRITGEVHDLLKAGAKIKLIAIDSVTGVMGRMTADSKSVTKLIRGDKAQTTQIGLEAQLGLQRQYGYHLLLTAQARANQNSDEVMRGEDMKAAVSFGCQHHCEYFVHIERLASKAGKVDALGREFRDESKLDAMGHGDLTGHRIRAWMQNSSMGPKDRMAEFTIDYNKGIVNVHEEVYAMGVNWGVVKKPNALSYEYKGQKWAGKPAFLKALAESPELQQAIISDMMEMDRRGKGMTVKPEVLNAV